LQIPASHLPVVDTQIPEENSADISMNCMAASAAVFARYDGLIDEVSRNLALTPEQRAAAIQLEAEATRRSRRSVESHQLRS
jgi:hypothetical protein